MMASIHHDKFRLKQDKAANLKLTLWRVHHHKLESAVTSICLTLGLIQRYRGGPSQSHSHHLKTFLTALLNIFHIFLEMGQHCI